MSGTYRALPTQVDLPAMEREILAFWNHSQIFEKSIAARSGAQPWTFYEGPPTANGLPGTHHIEARVFKDLFPRYHTMKGRYVPRRAGWDCHGLPVELAVEKELGFTGKQDIEKFGVAAFNQKCRESVLRHVDAFTEMTERMGFWVDFDQAYWTMSSEYVASVWWSLAQIWKKGLLVQDHRVAPYCPRCGTGLSDHELAQGYENITDPSVYVKFPITSGPLQEVGASFLVWTTTPWTLVSNTAIAVHPDVTYLLAENGEGERLVVAEDLLSSLGEGFTVTKKFIGSELEHTKYQRPFEWLEIPDAHFVVLAEYVTTTDGTGLVHQSPAFGADDLQVCRKYNLPVVNPIRGDGTFDTTLPLIAGAFFKDADKPLVRELKSRGLLFKQQSYDHSYPHCWRCHTPLMYYAQPSWYIRTTAIKEALLKENAKTDWHPSTIKSGRYGDWLENNIDWALSRNRYWGTPLPIWRCENDHPENMVCVESLAELSTLAKEDYSQLDPHRPFVDDVTIVCSQCSGTMRRVPEVIDCWYDSGAMPFAQLGYPHRPGSEEVFAETYPADFICEAIDQTRGWFYTLMTIGTLVFDKSSYKTVLCLGHILDKDGRKMSKHLGNVLEPMPLMDRHGADAVRWFMLAAGSPWAARRVGHDAITEVIRKSLLTYWNTVSFLTLYGSVAQFTPTGTLTLEHSLDRWIIAQLNETIGIVDSALSNFDSQEAGRALSTFIDDLSNWYVRRSRRRFWDGESAALETLHHCIEKLTLLMAPMVPFITEQVWQQALRPVDSSLPESVHLADFPRVDPSRIDSELLKKVETTRQIVELGRAARSTSQVKIRQPLGRALVAGYALLDKELQEQISEELNVHLIEDISQVGADLVTYSVKANFRSLGAKYGASVQEVAKLIAAANPGELVRVVRAGTGVAKLSTTFEITADDLVITETPKSGWAVATHDGTSVALDLTLTPELITEGYVREIIRVIQEDRKRNGFHVSDRIYVSWNGDSEITKAFQLSSAEIAAEVLALEISHNSQLKLPERESDDELSFVVELRKA
ncbi:MAG: isoleucine--tRNA ligase [Actinobacteria bacterium]|nr:isoleucine--tRNA ligase [Actinomycetota bacterium]